MVKVGLQLAVKALVTIRAHADSYDSTVDEVGRHLTGQTPPVEALTE